ncbi:MAG: response regulator [Solirubrobacteraceae bacterium]
MTSSQFARSRRSASSGWATGRWYPPLPALAAVEAAAKDGPFEIVLLDVMMPGVDGPSTLKHLRDGPLPDEVPVVFLTAKVRPEDQQRLRCIGATGVISKPFDPMTLPDEVDRILGKNSTP